MNICSFMPRKPIELNIIELRVRERHGEGKRAERQKGGGIESDLERERERRQSDAKSLPLDFMERESGEERITRMSVAGMDECVTDTGHTFLLM